MKKKVFVFGNPLVKKDALPLELIPFLRKGFPGIEFIEFDPTGNLSELGRDPMIIDSVEGIEKIIIIRDIDQIKTSRMYSLHDLDLGLNLKLLKKIGKLNSVTIFGIPMDGSKEKIKKELKEKLKKYFK